MLGLDLWSLTSRPQPFCCPPQAWAPHGMQFPAELTKDACVASQPAGLRLICIYFFTAQLFQVSRRWPRTLLCHRLARQWGQLTVQL